MPRAMQYETGIDRDRRIEARTLPTDALPAGPTFGFVADAGVDVAMRAH